MRVPFRVLFIRVPYYVGDPERDPNLENYQSMKQDGAVVGLIPWILCRNLGSQNEGMPCHTVSVTDMVVVRLRRISTTDKAPVVRPKPYKTLNP